MSRSKEEWFNTLEEPYKSKALKNCKPHLLKREEKDVFDALQAGFTWSTSPEGHKYWETYFKTLKKSMHEKQI